MTKEREKIIMTEFEKAYLAGFFDGEGCISISKHHKARNNTHGHCYGISISVSNTFKSVMIWLAQVTKSQCYIRQLRTKERKHRKIIWEWRCFANGARLFLENLLPYLKVKRKQAELVLEFLQYKGKQGRRVSNIEFQRRTNLYNKIKALNHGINSEKNNYTLPQNKQYQKQLNLENTL